MSTSNHEENTYHNAMATKEPLPNANSPSGDDLTLMGLPQEIRGHVYELVFERTDGAENVLKKFFEKVAAKKRATEAASNVGGEEDEAEVEEGEAAVLDEETNADQINEDVQEDMEMTDEGVNNEGTGVDSTNAPGLWLITNLTNSTLPTPASGQAQPEDEDMDGDEGDGSVLDTTNAAALPTASDATLKISSLSAHVHLHLASSPCPTPSARKLLLGTMKQRLSTSTQPPLLATLPTSRRFSSYSRNPHFLLSRSSRRPS